MTENKLIIFSKAPISGYVKTRLIPTLGTDKATQLHQYMLEQTIAMSSTLNNINCELHCAPDTSHQFFTILANKYNIKLVPQQNGDLGNRMSVALKESLINHKKCILIGTDCPEIDHNYIHQAFKKLDCVDVIIGPAKDGGYVLIGTKSHDDRLFHNINWSTSEVLKQTLQNIHHLNLKYNKMTALLDIDNGDDLDHLPSHYLHNALKEITQ